MRWEGKQVWMELKELRETRQEKSQEMAALSGLEHTVMLWRASVSAAPSLSLSTSGAPLSSTEKEEDAELGAQSRSRAGQMG